MSQEHIFTVNFQDYDFLILWLRATDSVVPSDSAEMVAQKTDILHVEIILSSSFAKNLTYLVYLLQT